MLSLARRSFLNTCRKWVVCYLCYTYQRQSVANARERETVLSNVYIARIVQSTQSPRSLSKTFCTHKTLTSPTTNSTTTNSTTTTTMTTTSAHTRRLIDLHAGSEFYLNAQIYATFQACAITGVLRQQRDYRTRKWCTRFHVRRICVYNSILKPHQPKLHAKRTPEYSLFALSGAASYNYNMHIHLCL